MAITLNLFRNGAVGFIDWLDDLVSFESVGLFLKFLLAQWTVTNLRTRDKHLSAAAQRNERRDVIGIAPSSLIPAGRHEDAGVFTSAICAGSNERHVVHGAQGLSC